MRKTKKEKRKWQRVKRRTASIILSVAMILTAVPVDMAKASADGDVAAVSEDGTVPAGYTESGSAGTGVDYYYYAEGSTDTEKTFAAGTLYIKGTGAEDCAMTEGTSASEYAWYSLCAKKVVVEDVPAITQYAFANNMSLEEVAFSGVTTLGTSLFLSSLNLKKIDLGEDMGTAAVSRIRNLPRLTYLKLPATITSLTGSFRSKLFTGCTNLRDIAICYSDEETAFSLSVVASGCGLTKANFYVMDLEGSVATAIKGNNVFANTEDGTLKEGYTLNTMDAFEKKSARELEISAEESYYLGYVPEFKIVKNTTGNEQVDTLYYTITSTSITSRNEEYVKSYKDNYYSCAITEGDDDSFATVSNIVNFDIVEGYVWSLQDGVLTLQAKEGLSRAVVPTMSSDAPWYAERDTITKVVVKNTITSLGGNLFQNYSSLREVIFEEGSILESIGTNTFCGSGLTSITIPDSVTSIGSGTFSKTQLTTLTIPENVKGTVDVDISTLTELCVYGNCEISVNSGMKTTLQKVVFGKNAETIPDSAFSNFSGLTDLVIEEGCAIKSIGASAFTLSGLTGEVTIPGTIESIGEKAFVGTSLEKVVIEDSENNISLGKQAFDGISEMVIKNTGLLQCGDYALGQLSDDCVILLYASDVTNLDGSALTTSSSPLYMNAKITCQLTSETAYTTLTQKYQSSQAPAFVLLRTGVQTTEDGIAYVVDYGEKNVMIVGYSGDAAQVVIPDTISDMPVTQIGTDAFKNVGVTKVTLPASVTEISQGAFDGCTSLTDINLESVVKIGNSAFRRAPLESVTFSENLVSIGEYAFFGGLKGDIILPDSVQSIGRHAFYSCGPEEGTCRIRLPENETYTKIEVGTFLAVNSNTVMIPSNITEIADAFNRPGFRGLKKGVYVLQLETENLTTIPEGLSSYALIENKDCATYQALQNAGYTIVSSSEEAKSELTTVLSEAEKKLSESIKTDYQEEYLTVLEKSISTGKQVLDNTESQLGDYLAAASEINSAEYNFYTFPASASAELETLRSRIAEIEKQYVSDDYTEASWAEVLDAMDDANAYLEGSSVKYKSVAQEKLTKLNGAIDGLVKKTPGSPTPGSPTPGSPTPSSPTPNSPAPNSPAPNSPAPNKSGTNKEKAPSKKVTVKKVSLKKVRALKKCSIKVTWKKLSGVSGYQIRIGTNKKMTKNKKVITVKKAKTVTKTIKKLKKNKKYFVKVRAYKKVNGKKKWGSWSKVKTVKVKK